MGGKANYVTYRSQHFSCCINLTSVVLLSQKATRKTDKPRPEDLDVTELTSEGLKDELLKYGVNAGPIVGESVSLLVH